LKRAAKREEELDLIEDEGNVGFAVSLSLLWLLLSEEEEEMLQMLERHELDREEEGESMNWRYSAS
jgi:hypothetical protein